MRKIDIHTHILPPEIPPFKKQFGYGGFITLDNQPGCDCRMLKDDGTFFRTIEKNSWDPEARLADLKEFEVTSQVISTVPVMFSYWAQPKDGLVVSQFLNDHIAETVNPHPQKFIGLGTVPLQDPELAIKELERCMTSLNLAGVQIGTNINGKNLDDPRFHSFFARAQDLGASIFVHPWEVAGADRMERYFLSWLVGMPSETTLAITSFIFGGIFDRFPNLKVAFAHGGGSFAYLLGRLSKGFEVRPDLCRTHEIKNPRDYVSRFFVDSLVHDPKTLKFLVETMGADQVVLGTDYPFALKEDIPSQAIHENHFSRETEEKLCFRNALRWLGKDGNGTL